MRKTIFTLVAALAVAFASFSPAAAGGLKKHPHKVAIVAGVVVGTVVGVSLANGSSWLGTSSLAGIGATTGGAVAGGLLAGIATTAMIHALTTPCQGFDAIFMGKGCKNGKLVGKR